MMRLAALSSLLLLFLITTITPGTLYADEIESVTIDAAKRYQKMIGFGSSVWPWNKQFSAKTASDRRYAKIYVHELGFTVLRVGISPDILYNDNIPVAYEQIAETIDAHARRVQIRLKDWKPVLRDGKPIIETLDWSVFRRVGKWAQTLKQEYPDLYVIASAWSPPAWMKRPNKKYGITMTSMGGSFNTQYARHYGKFLVEWARLMQKEFGVEVKALSIQNEPLFFEPYDSCQYKRDGSDYHTVYKAVTEEFAKAAVPMKFFINEDMLRFPNRVMDMIKPVLDDPDLLPTVAAVATHGYLDGVQMDADPKSGAALYDMVHPYGKETWLSEFGGGWSLEWIRNNPDKRGRGILHDIGFGMTGFLGYNNASLVAIWQLWNGKEEKVLTPILGNPDEGYILSRKAHALKHFTKYIRPGMYRVDTGEVLRNGWACMAFSDKAGRERLTIELVSKRKSDLIVTIALRNHTAERFAVYRTSADEGHVRRKDAIVEQGYVRVMLPKESIVSLVYGG